MATDLPILSAVILLQRLAPSAFMVMETSTFPKGSMDSLASVTTSPSKPALSSFPRFLSAIRSKNLLPSPRPFTVQRSFRLRGIKFRTSGRANIALTNVVSLAAEVPTTGPWETLELPSLSWKIAGIKTANKGFS